MSTWSLTYESMPWSLNQERKSHWSWRAERAQEWRGAFHLLAMEAKVPALAKIAVVVSVEGPGILQDVGNCYPAAKAAVDGLVDARVIPDDIPEHLVLLGFTPPRRAKRARTTLDVFDASEVGAVATAITALVAGDLGGGPTQ